MSEAFRQAERARRYRKGATAAQRRHLKRLARRAGVELPRVSWADDASRAIDRLEHHIRQPALEGV